MSHLYKRMCPSVRLSDPCYFRRWKVCILGASCAVYPALFIAFELIFVLSFFTTTTSCLPIQRFPRTSSFHLICRRTTVRTSTMTWYFSCKRRRKKTLVFCAKRTSKRSRISSTRCRASPSKPLGQKLRNSSSTILNLPRLSCKPC